MAKYGLVVKKILNILANGFILNLTKDKRQRFQLHKECDRIWYTEVKCDGSEFTLTPAKTKLIL